MSVPAATSRRLAHPAAALLDPELQERALAAAAVRLGRPLTAGERRIDLVRLDRELAAGKERLVAAIETERRSAASRYARDVDAGRPARLRLRLSPAIRAAIRALYRAGRDAARGELARAGFDPDRLPRALAERTPVRLQTIEGRVTTRLAELGTENEHRLAIAVDLSTASRTAILDAVRALPGVRALAADFTSVPAYAGLGSVWDEADAAGVTTAWTYTAVMDDATCETCAGLDGETYDSWEAIQEVLPDGGPNPDCDGGDRCRCRAVPEFGEPGAPGEAPAPEPGGGPVSTGFVGPEAAPIGEITPDDLTGGLQSWIASPQSMRIHMDALLNPEGASRYVDLPGSGKEFRREAQAVLDEIRNNGRLNDVTLYRGGGGGPLGKIPSSWTPDKRVAQRFAGKGGRVETLQPGEGFGIRVSDYVGEGVSEEKQWLIVKPETPIPDWLGETAISDLRDLRSGYLTRDEAASRAAREGNAAGFHPYFLPQEGYEAGDWATPVLRDQQEAIFRVGRSIDFEAQERSATVVEDLNRQEAAIEREIETGRSTTIAATRRYESVRDSVWEQMKREARARGETTVDPEALHAHPEVAEAEAAMERAKAEQFARVDWRERIREQQRTAYRDGILESLSELRSLGKTETVDWRLGVGRMEARDLLDESARFYPTDWIERTGPIDMRIDEEARGFHRLMEMETGPKGHFIQTNTRGDRLQTTIHELAHAQEVDPRILDAERAFYDYRTTQAESGRFGSYVGAQQRYERMGEGYQDWETTRPDGFYSRYAGKEYRAEGAAAARNYELLTMGLQALWSEPWVLDAEYRAWLLGILASL